MFKCSMARGVSCLSGCMCRYFYVIMIGLFIIYLLVSIVMQKEIDKPYEKHHTMKEKVEGLRYCRAIKEFLENYKTKKCHINY